MSSYLEDFQRMPDRNVWHGINVVALLDRARRDRVPPGVDADPRVLAGRILAVVEAKDQEQTADMWDFGTAMEACVALGNVTGALGWVERYIRSDHADAFELASTLRQMEELWGMDESQDPGRVLLPVLRGALLRKEGSSVQLDARSAEAAPDDGVVDYEAVLGRESFRSIRWWRTAMVRVHSIARVESTRGAEGSGFLIDSQDLWPDHPRRVLFVTNHHVVRNAESGATRVHFTTWTRKPNEFLIDRVLASSTERELDTAIVALRPAVEPVKALPCAESLPNHLGLAEPPRLYIIGHPAGGELTISLYDNHFLGIEGPYVRYRSPTTHGHSGSPVFNDQWLLVACHHGYRRGTGKGDCNEGVLIKEIRSRIRPD